MSHFEAELRLPAKQPYAYINIVVRGDSWTDFQDDLELVAQPAFQRRLTQIHADAAAIVMSGGKVVAEAKPAAPQAAVFQEAKPDAAALITSELGGKVISETEKKPWEQTVAPQAQPWSQSSALADF